MLLAMQFMVEEGRSTPIAEDTKISALLSVHEVQMYDYKHGKKVVACTGTARRWLHASAAFPRDGSYMLCLSDILKHMTKDMDEELGARVRSTVELSWYTSWGQDAEHDGELHTNAWPRTQLQTGT